MSATGNARRECLNPYMEQESLLLTYGPPKKWMETGIRKDIFHHYLQEFDEQHVLFFNSL